MKWKTAISNIQNNENTIHGKKLVDIARATSFAGNVYFILTGTAPTPEIEKLMNMLLSISIDHGAGTVSTQSARIAASAGATFQQCLIAGIATMGPSHGGATEDAAHWLKECVASGKGAGDAVSEALASKKKIPGYGHSILTEDYRVVVLLDEAKTLGLIGSHTEFAQEVAKEIEKQKGKKIPFNIDGVIASLALDLGISPNAATGLFIVGRLPGLVAHIQEEREQGNGLRRIPEEDIEYTG